MSHLSCTDMTQARLLPPSRRQHFAERGCALLPAPPPRELQGAPTQESSKECQAMHQVAMCSAPAGGLHARGVHEVLGRSIFPNGLAQETTVPAKCGAPAVHRANTETSRERHCSPLVHLA